MFRIYVLVTCLLFFFFFLLGCSGAIYLDSDVIVLNSWSSLNNTIGLENSTERLSHSTEIPEIDYSILLKFLLLICFSISSLHFMFI
jgi:lipopolysaccharide biosynthesis glycosyltransferase